MDDVALDRLADLAVSVGANVQPGQIVCVNADVDRLPLTRAVTKRAYERGAKYVEVTYEDPWLRRAKIENAGDDAIGFAPSWAVDRVREMGEQHVALIRLEGAFDPAALEGVDGDRLGRDAPPTRVESLKLVSERLVNWTIVPAPTQAWADMVHPELETDARLPRLWKDIEHICRLDNGDALSAWKPRMEQLQDAARRMTERGFSAVAFRGEGTDLTIGLLPSHRWMAASFERADGLWHHPNLPTEEVFTTPDPERVDGVVRSTKPLDLEGTMVRGLTVRFEGGHAVQIDADTGAEALRSRAALDENASRLGEVALVDGEGRIGELDTVFYTTLIDENAASHIALGAGFGFTLDDESVRSRVNMSQIHIDFMIGSPEMEVDGITQDGERVPVLRGGAWQV